MIRLFVSDIDGTMLADDSTELDPVYFEEIQEMRKRGILFCVASGRPYLTLQHLFAPVKDDIIYITQNGAAVFYKDKLISSSCMSKDDSEQLVRDTYAIPGAQVLYCTEKMSYCGSNDFECYHLMSEHFHFQMEMVEDPTKLPMPCIKYSLYLKSGVEEKTAEYFVPHWAKTHEVACGGKYFMDVMKRGTNKGTALQNIMNYFSLTPGECAACGDNSNDIEMLQTVFYSIAVQNARKEVRDVCRYVTDSNNELGVYHAMKKINESASLL
jgi:Cof subfamily protein (haloacid dehalogenase superfamily)